MRATAGQQHTARASERGARSQETRDAGVKYISTIVGRQARHRQAQPTRASIQHPTATENTSTTTNTGKTHVREVVDKVVLFPRVRFQVEEVVRVVVARAALAAVGAGAAVAGNGEVRQGVLREDVLVEGVPPGAPLVRQVLVLAGSERSLGEVELRVTDPVNVSR